MMAGSEMSSPVTRGELREELQQLEGRFDEKLERLEVRLESRFDEKLERLESRFDHKLDMWGGALLARMESSIESAIKASEQRLIAELGRHVRAVEESTRTQIAALDEKYSDLPAR